MTAIGEYIQDEEKYITRDTLVIPLEYTKLLVDDNFETAEILIQDKKHQIYAKTINGQSQLNFKNGNLYSGEVFKGMMHGKGQLKWVSGTKFEGDFVYNILRGQGEYFWPDGSYYKGDILNGLRHGNGMFVEAQNRAKYTGQWVNGQRQGKGKLEFPSKASYTGDFKDGLKDGNGIFKYPSGNYYEGEFKKDAKHGQGTMFWLDENERYIGSWENNFQNGFGEHIWLEGKGEKKQLRNRYEGQWKDGERHGYGVFFYADGSRYSGEWTKSLKEGYGVFIGVDGHIIQGYYKSDRLIRNILDQPMYVSLNLDDILESPHLTNTSINTPSKLKMKHNSLLVERKSNLLSNKAQVAPTSGLSTKIQQLQSVASKKKSNFNPINSVPEIDEINTNPPSSRTQLEISKVNTDNFKVNVETPKINVELMKKQIDESRKVTEETPKANINNKARKSNQQIDKIQNQLLTQAALKPLSTGNKDLQANPYIQLIDYSDLDIHFTDPKETHLNVETILLRNNSQLIQLFKECSTRYESKLGDSSFALDLQQVWKFLKEIKVLGDSVTISVINRSFARGNKNSFKIKMTEQEIIEEINLLKSIGRFVTEEERKNIKLVEFLHSIRKQSKEASHLPSPVSSIAEVKTPDLIAPEEEINLQLTDQGDVHSEEQIILFRHFVDILVRVAFFRSNSPDFIDKDLEKMIENHIRPWMENKKKVKNVLKNQSEDEIQKTNIMRNLLKKDLSQAFNCVKKITKTSKFGGKDETCFLRDVIILLNKENHLRAEGDQQFIYSILESNFDPNWTLGNIDSQIKEREKEREKEQMRGISKRNQKLPVQPRKKTPDFKKMKTERICKLLNTELIFSEFNQVILLLFIKQIKEHSPKIDDDNLEKKLSHIIQKISQNQVNKPAEATQFNEPSRKWPQSIKDLLKIQLKNEKIQRDEMEKERKRKEEEKKKEQLLSQSGLFYFILFLNADNVREHKWNFKTQIFLQILMKIVMMNIETTTIYSLFNFILTLLNFIQKNQITFIQVRLISQL